MKAVCECSPPPKNSKALGCGDSCLNRSVSIAPLSSHRIKAELFSPRSMMQYLCHPSSCPNGDRCSNKSLHKRQACKLKVFWVLLSLFTLLLLSLTSGRRCACGQTGSRGFGLKAVDRIPADTFVIDCASHLHSTLVCCADLTSSGSTQDRGEIIPIPSYYKRILDEYKGRNDHYALEYGEGEVIDAGQQGNIARFINRPSCLSVASASFDERC